MSEKNIIYLLLNLSALETLPSKPPGKRATSFLCIYSPSEYQRWFLPRSPRADLLKRIVFPLSKKQLFGERNENRRKHPSHAMERKRTQGKIRICSLSAGFLIRTEFNGRKRGKTMNALINGIVMKQISF